MINKNHRQVFDRFFQYRHGNDMLDEIVKWISTNLEPEDVFSEEKLTEWAEYRGFEKHLHPL